MQKKTDAPAVLSGREIRFSLPLPFYSLQGLNRLEDAHLYLGGQAALLSLPIQMLTSSGNTLTDRPRNNVQPNIWVLRGLVKLKYKINNHNGHQKTSFFCPIVPSLSTYSQNSMRQDSLLSSNHHTTLHSAERREGIKKDLLLRAVQLLHTPLNCVRQDLIMWPYLAAKEARKYGLYYG